MTIRHHLRSLTQIEHDAESATQLCIATAPSTNESFMSGFVIFHYNIIDRSRVDELGPLSMAIVEKHGAEILVASPVKPQEGTTYSHMIIYRLESFDAALKFYHCDEMKELAKLRNQIIQGISMILPGHTETDAVVKSGYFSQPS